jgi:hypothetical protein
MIYPHERPVISRYIAKYRIAGEKFFQAGQWRAGEKNENGKRTQAFVNNSIATQYQNHRRSA